MRKFFIIMIAMALAMPLFSLSTEELRGIMSAETATIEQGFKLALATADEEADTDAAVLTDYRRLRRFEPEGDLTIGIFAKIAIEAGLAKGGLFYKITGSCKYSTSALQHSGVVPESYSFNRTVSGPELLEYINILDGVEEPTEESLTDGPDIEMAVEEPEPVMDITDVESTEEVPEVTENQEGGDNE